MIGRAGEGRQKEKNQPSEMKTVTEQNKKEDKTG
jgi:hypothetical protein